MSVTSFSQFGRRLVRCMLLVATAAMLDGAAWSGAAFAQPIADQKYAGNGDAPNAGQHATDPAGQPQPPPEIPAVRLRNRADIRLPAWSAADRLPPAQRDKAHQLRQDLFFTLEPAASCLLLDLPPASAAPSNSPVQETRATVRELVSDLAALRESVARQEAEKGNTEPAGEDDQPNAPEARPTETGPLSEELRALEGLARAMAALIDPPADAQAASTARRRAAADISFLIESRDEAWRTAARTWQIELRIADGDLKRAEALLPRPLADPPEGMERYALFGELQRCRLLMKQHRHALALAVLLQLEERAFEWLRDGKEDAQRAIGLIELRVLQSWRDALIAAGGDTSSSADWCVKKMRQIIADRLDGEHPTVLRLESTLPIAEAK